MSHSDAPGKKRHPLLVLLRGGFAVALIWLVISQVHWNDYSVTNEAGETVMSPGLLSSLTGVSPGLLAAALAVSVASMLVAAMRWRLLLRVQDVNVTTTKAIRLQFVGEFFNAVIPGMVGGDLVKAYWLGRQSGRKEHIFVSVFIDRLLGVCGLVFTALVMLAVICFLGQRDVNLVRLSIPSVAAVSTASVVALAFLLSPHLRALLHLDKVYSRLPIAEHIQRAGDALQRYRKHPGLLIRAFLVGLMAQALNTLFVLLLGLALGLDLSWAHYFLHVPLIMIISAVPLTPGGIGLVEQLYLLYFAAAGNPSLVLALAVLVRAVTILSDLPGGAITLLSGIRLSEYKD